MCTGLSGVSDEDNTAKNRQENTTHEKRSFFMAMWMLGNRNFALVAEVTVCRHKTALMCTVLSGVSCENQATSNLKKY